MKINPQMKIQLDTVHPEFASSYAVVGRDFATALNLNGHTNVVIASLMGGHKPSYTKGLTVYPQRQQTSTALSSSSSQMVVNKENPHLNISIINPRLLEVDIFARYRNWIAWTPSETDEMMDSDVKVIEEATAIWGMSKFVTESIKRAMPHKTNIYYMPCIINDSFRPYRRDVARTALATLSMNAIHIGESIKLGSPESNKMRVTATELAGAIIYGMVGANTKDPSRKGFYKAIEVFAHVLKRVPNAYLYLHTSSTQGEEWWKLASLLGVAHRVISPRPEMYDHNIYTTDDLALIMSAFDVLVTTSWGEGDGLPLKEAQACGIPVIGLEHTSITEHTQKGLLVRYHNGYDDIAPMHDTRRWYSNWDIQPIVSKWVQFAKMSAQEISRHQITAYEYGQTFKGDVVYKNHIAPFFELFEFNDASHESFSIRELMNKWLADGHIA